MTERARLVLLIVLAAALIGGPPTAEAVRPGSTIRDLPVATASTIESLAVMSDGRIVVAGRPSYFSSWIRVHLPDGGLDGSFGTAGHVSFGPPADLRTTGPLITLPQPDGRVLYATLNETFVGIGGPPAFVLGRLTRAGRPDPEFGSGGSVTPEVGPSSVVTDFALQPDGRILIIAVRQDAIVLARLLPDGTPDSAFGNGGIASVPHESPFDDAVLAVQPRRGAIVLAPTGAGPVIARFLPNGSLDPGFGSGPGLQPVAVANRRVDLTSGVDALVRRDGRIRIAATSGERWDRLTLVGLGPAGRPDRSFGREGVAIAPRAPALGPVFAQAIAADAAGGIYLAGQAALEGDNFVAVLRRFLRDGRPDPSFGDHGVVRLQQGGFGDGQKLLLAVQPPGKLVVADSLFSARYGFLGTPLLRQVAAGYDRARPRLAIRSRCRHSAIRITLRIRDASPLERVVIRVDGHRVRTSRHKRLRLRLRAGPHRLSVSATDLAGNTRIRHLKLSRCADR
jgi:uncharacterized delta-60 repeat protein